MTRLRLRKILRDMWLTRTRVAMMLIAITVSVTAVGAFLGARAILGREITVNYAQTHPASATIDLAGPVTDSMLAAARREANVSSAVARASALARIRVAGGSWRTLVLFVSDPRDPGSVSVPTVESGTWPPQPTQIFLERTALPFVGVHPGGRVQITAAAGAPVDVLVAGVVHDGGVAPADQEQTAYGYTTSAGMATLGASPVLNQLKIVVGARNAPSGDRVLIARTAEQLAKTLESSGHRVTDIDVPPPLRHPHQGQMETVGFALLAFGLVSLLVSSILVATMLGGMLAGQTKQIGAMKTIGARTGQILAMYLSMTAAISLVATAIAIWPGVVLGQLLAQAGASLLNLTLYDTSIPAWVILTVIAAGVVVPMIVAIVPLSRGTRISIRHAIDNDSAGGAAIRGGGILSRWRAVQGAPTLVLRNMVRRRGRFALTVALLAVAGTMFLTGLNTASGWSALVDQGIANRHYDLEVRLNAPEPAARLTQIVDQVDGVASAEAWGRTPTAVSVAGQVDVSHAYPDDDHGTFTIMAPPAKTPLITLPVLSGRWLTPGDVDAVVLNNLVPAQQAPGVRVGDRIHLAVNGKPTSWRVVGIVSDFGTQGTAYLTDNEYAGATGGSGQAQMLRIVTSRHDSASRQHVLNSVENALDAAGIGVEEDFTVNTLQTALDDHVLVLADALIAIAVLMGFVGLLGLASAISTNVVERTREFGILHTIGATPSIIRGLVLGEGVLTGAVSIAIGIVLALPVTKVFGDFIGANAFLQPLPYTVSGPAMLLWSVATIAGAALASVLPAQRANRLTVRQALTTL